MSTIYEQTDETILVLNLQKHYQIVLFKGCKWGSYYALKVGIRNIGFDGNETYEVNS